MRDSSFFLMLCVFVCVAALGHVYTIKESGAIHDYPIFISRASTPLVIKIRFSELLH